MTAAVTEIIDQGAARAMRAEEAHRAAIIEAMGKSALQHMVEHRATSLRLRRLLHGQLADFEESVRAIPEPAALDGQLYHLPASARQAIYHGLSMHSRHEALGQLIEMHGKLVAVDLKLIGFEPEPVAPVEDADGLLPADRALLERLRARFNPQPQTVNEPAGG